MPHRWLTSFLWIPVTPAITAFGCNGWGDENDGGAAQAIGCDDGGDRNDGGAAQAIGCDDGGDENDGAASPLLPAAYGAPRRQE